MGIAGDMRMLGIAEGARGVVHRTDDVTGERQGGIVASSLCGECGYVVIPLGTIDALG